MLHGESEETLTSAEMYTKSPSSANKEHAIYHGIVHTLICVQCLSGGYSQQCQSFHEVVISSLFQKNNSPPGSLRPRVGGVPLKLALDLSLLLTAPAESARTDPVGGALVWMRCGWEVALWMWEEGLVRRGDLFVATFSLVVWRR